MSELEDTIDEGSPFHADNAPGLSLIVLMRIYDVQMAILDAVDADSADRIYEAHQIGKIISSLPNYTGVEDE